MDFKIVDIPTNLTRPSPPIIEALLANVGRALALPLETRDPNTIRKTLRATLSNRGILKIFYFRTRVNFDNKTLIVWLEKIPATNFVVDKVVETENE